MINVSDNRPRNIVLKYKMPLIKGENSIFSIDCLYANDCAPIPKRSCAYTRFEKNSLACLFLPYPLRLEKNAEENQCNADIEGEVDFTTFAKDEECQDDGITRFEVIGQVNGKGRKALQGLDLQEIHTNGTEQ